MKFELISGIFIRFILATIQTEHPGHDNSTNQCTDISIDNLIELYKSDGQLTEFNSVINWIMHYICHKELKSKIKNQLLRSANSFFISSHNIDGDKEYILHLMINSVEKDSDLLKFSQPEFDLILLQYYCIYHQKTSEQAKINKKIFEEILKTRTDIKKLYINTLLYFEKDIYNLIVAMGNNLEHLIIYFPFSSNIENIFKKCKESFSKSIELDLTEYYFNANEFNDVSSLFNNFKIHSLVIYNSDLRSLLPHISFFESLKNNRDISNLEIRRSKLSLYDIDCIINALSSNHTSITTLTLTYLDKENTLISFFNQLCNDKKLKTLIFEDNIITENILKNISLFLMNNNCLELFVISSNHINSSNIKFIVDGLKMNTGLHSIEFKFNCLDINGYTLMLNAISENSGSSLENITFKVNKNIINSAEENDKDLFKESIKKIVCKKISFKCNWLCEIND